MAVTRAPCVQFEPGGPGDVRCMTRKPRNRRMVAHVQQVIDAQEGTEAGVVIVTVSGQETIEPVTRQPAIEERAVKNFCSRQVRFDRTAEGIFEVDDADASYITVKLPVEYVCLVEAVVNEDGRRFRRL